MTCDHTIRLPDRYVTWEDDWTGEEHGEWEYNRTESALNDIDLHRMKCSLCGKIEYYSGAARDYYEKGIPSPYITGFK
jgi:hypothetical protein